MLDAQALQESVRGLDGIFWMNVSKVIALDAPHGLGRVGFLAVRVLGSGWLRGMVMEKS